MSREVMKQALEAIRIFREWEMGQDYESHRDTVLARAFAAEEALNAALAEQDAPVAWINAGRDVLTSHPESWGRECEEWTPLYAHPAPQRKPLRTITYVCPVCAASLERQE